MCKLNIAITFLALAHTVCAQTTGTVSPFQSPASPYNLDIIAPVQLSGSDSAAAAFNSNVLPSMLDIVERRLAETVSIEGATAMAIDPANLVLAYDANIRVYFLGEGAGYANTLGFSTTGGGPLSPDAALIFPNASSPTGLGGNGSPLRSSNEPLLPGDFVNLGTFTAGTSLEFFLVANGAYGGGTFYSTNTSLNMDGIVHAVSLAPNGSAYLILGFEDLWGGGDRDYNDLVFAVEVGRANVQHLSSLGAPEPSMAASAALAIASCFGIRRRRKSAI